MAYTQKSSPFKYEGPQIGDTKVHHKTGQTMVYVVKVVDGKNKKVWVEKPK